MRISCNSHIPCTFFTIAPMLLAATKRRVIDYGRIAASLCIA
jgi:hypothetical protein